MVVIVILGGPANDTHQILVNNVVVAPQVSKSRSYRHEEPVLGFPQTSYQKRHGFNRSISATTAESNNKFNINQCYQKPPPQSHFTSPARDAYCRSLSVPQLALGQRFGDNNNLKSHAGSWSTNTTNKTTKANRRQCRSRRDNDGGEGDDVVVPVIRHITRVNICDASPHIQLDLAASHSSSAIATTEAEPVTREGKRTRGGMFLIIEETMDIW